ncbi:cytochrome P450 [Planomonospora venezuelensis]|uniref:Cytochrome P450 n=1 Tax=Planomonospora venezuelensis TaxID=1999 RepID=A0A841CUJ9_PLAVE|nr:cytochrome P450 [Planomonospora venezuelensis]MBB5961511.1 cytochrome P450 [Planomonospora venezuelensis]GIM98655.1 cytochrome P450 [Planomonospora venezuelensis]
MTAEPDPNGLWPDPVPGPLGTPPPEFARRRESGPLEPAAMPSGDRVPVAVRYEDVRALLASPASSRNLRLPGLPRLVSGIGIDDDPDALINQDPPEHTRYRRIMQGTFTPRQIEPWRPRVAKIAEELLDGLGGDFDLVQGYALQLPGRVICEMLGVPVDDYAQFVRWTDMFLTTSTATEQARYQGYTDFMAYAAELVARHRAEPGGDLIDLLIQARDEDDRLSEGELVNTVFSLITAGHETTASMIARGVFRLLLHPRQWAELVADPALAGIATEEILRYDGPPASAFMRRITEDTVIPSGPLSAGTVVMPNLNAANHDPQAFPDPGRFDIRRFTEHPPSPHVAFGYGPHRCLAASLARVELTEAVRALATRCPGLRLTAPPDSVAWTDGLVYRPVALHVTTGPADAGGGA